jgi:hypothetical protein
MTRFREKAIKNEANAWSGAFPDQGGRPWVSSQAITRTGDVRTGHGVDAMCGIEPNCRCDLTFITTMVCESILAPVARKSNPICQLRVAGCHMKNSKTHLTV